MDGNCGLHCLPVSLVHAGVTLGVHECGMWTEEGEEGVACRQGCPPVLPLLELAARAVHRYLKGHSLASNPAVSFKIFLAAWTKSGMESLHGFKASHSLVFSYFTDAFFTLQGDLCPLLGLPSSLGSWVVPQGRCSQEACTETYFFHFCAYHMPAELYGSLAQMEVAPSHSHLRLSVNFCSLHCAKLFLSLYYSI